MPVLRVEDSLGIDQDSLRVDLDSLGLECSSWVRRCGARRARARVEPPRGRCAWAGAPSGAPMLRVMKATEGHVVPQVREVRRRLAASVAARDGG
jgi:hypothetical protein